MAADSKTKTTIIKLRKHMNPSLVLKKLRNLKNKFGGKEQVRLAKL